MLPTLELGTDESWEFLDQNRKVEPRTARRSGVLGPTVPRTVNKNGGTKPGTERRTGFQYKEGSRTLPVQYGPSLRTTFPLPADLALEPLGFRVVTAGGNTTTPLEAGPSDPNCLGPPRPPYGSRTHAMLPHRTIKKLFYISRTVIGNCEMCFSASLWPRDRLSPKMQKTPISSTRPGAKIGGEICFPSGTSNASFCLWV